MVLPVQKDPAGESVRRFILGGDVWRGPVQEERGKPGGERTMGESVVQGRILI